MVEWLSLRDGQGVPAPSAAASRPTLILAFLVASVASLPASIGAAAAPPASSPATAVGAPPPCIASGTEADINAVLVGPSATAELCPGAVFQLHGPVVLSAPGQSLVTAGEPTGGGRARLELVDPAVTTAIRFVGQSGARVAHLVVDGRRSALGYLAGGALIEGGGNATDQLVEHLLIRDARAWSALHIVEGAMPAGCANAVVRNNEIIGPRAVMQEWSDGISFACTSSQVVDNVVTDASDGSIVVFGAPHTLVARNTITAKSQESLGGINLVDYAPYGGDYTGTVVRDNVIRAEGAPIHLGIAQGWSTWFCTSDDAGYAANTLRGATVADNDLGGDLLIYGMVVSDVKDWTVEGNVVAPNAITQPAVYGCNGAVAVDPTEFAFSPDTVSGSFQPEFESGHLRGVLYAVTTFGLPVQVGPGSPTTTAPSTTPPPSATIPPSAPIPPSAAVVPITPAFTG